MAYTRAHIRLNTVNDINAFVSEINRDGTANKYTIENFDGKIRVSARSMMGVLYAMTDFNDEMFIVNETVDGVFPHVVDSYRV